MPAADIAAVDPVAAARTWLLSHPTVTAALGGEGRVGVRNQPPYPCVVLEDPPSGDDRGLVWLMAPEITIRVLGDLDGTPGKAALRRILLTVLVSLKELAEATAPPGAPVVTNVATFGTGWRPEPTGQPAYVSTARMHMHPPHVPAP